MRPLYESSSIPSPVPRNTHISPYSKYSGQRTPKTASDIHGKHRNRVAQPPIYQIKSPQQGDRMFEYEKAQVEILDSAADDMLAASMYGGVSNKRRKEKTKKKTTFSHEKKTGVSGYNFDSLM
jgi:hypothetical protein